MDRMHSFQIRLESWLKDQRDKVLKVSWGPLQWKMRWPLWNSNDREQRKKIQIEYERRKQQLHDLCHALKAESVADLQEILCCMVLSECVYKRPSSELLRAVNKFKADFGGQIVPLERVQPSSDHVPHRYLLAEAGDTLFASFIGTKQYKDVMADVNILQGAIFHEDVVENGDDGTEVMNFDQDEICKGKFENLQNPLGSKAKKLKDKYKPAAHRGFLARAKGIPALELYRLAQKKKQKLVLCGHSLGGAVAVLATLAILRGISASSSLKENEKFHVRCITFSQPPVGNAALRDYVNRKGWKHHFKSYCIPEDLVPRLLSPAYFHHYNAQPLNVPAETRATNLLMTKHEEGAEKPKEKDGEQLVLGLGPVQTSFWRLSKLVPLESVRRQVSKYRGKYNATAISASDSVSTPILEDDGSEPQSLEIEEGSDGISLKPISDSDDGPSANVTSAKKNGDERNWRRMPYLPSYVPFGELYLLGNSTVESLSGAEYSKLTSVSSVIAELRERFQSHSMKSYRSRFQKIFESCMKDDDVSSIMGVEQMQQFPHLQQWLGFSVAGTVKIAHIVESPVIRTASSVVPLGWSGIPGQKNSEPLKVDVSGFGLHLCTLVHAQVNGNWCSTRVESYPPVPTISSSDGVPELQKMRVVVGTPLKRPPNHETVADSAVPLFPTTNSSVADSKEHKLTFNIEKKFICPEGLNDFSLYCTSDFATVMKEVHVRTRRVRLLGLEGSGKSSLFKAIVGQCRMTPIGRIEHMLPATGAEEAVASGICYCDSPGVNLQELKMEASHFRDELWTGIRDLSRKTDLLVLVHNLSHKVPFCVQSNGSQPKPALSLLLDEAKSLGIPWVLAITNKFSVSAHQQKSAIEAVMQAYQASPATTGIINSCPYIFIPSAATASLSTSAIFGDSDMRMAAQKLILAPVNLVRRPFQNKETVLPVEGVNSLCQLVHRVLRSHEETAFQELARERILVELECERAMSIDAAHDAKAKENSLTAAAVGASLGAGLGIVLAVVMGAASALRKP